MGRASRGVRSCSPCVAIVMRRARMQRSKLDSEIRKFLVFAHHQVLLDAVEKAANQKRVGYIRIDSNVTGDKRQREVNKFQEDAACRVAILSIKAAGVGLTLTSASHVIFAEMYWVPGMFHTLCMRPPDAVHGCTWGTRMLLV
jgi:SNF2 family DNA or RNA helicase